mmetsp:Transcript_28905/g.47959  ORF Transcript_28905/g.47959 Transcript_28905/m.47959 type:complete len:448 (-) Transcript_28905:484-1827(-)
MRATGVVTATRWAVIVGCGVLAQNPDSKDPASANLLLERNSFAAPHSTTNEFTGFRTIDNWDAGGSASVHRSFVRITPEKQGQKGWISSRVMFSEPEWSLVMELRASGSSPYLYGDGLAIWLTETFEHIEGPVFGREDYWKGLGIFFDTFQNIDQNHHHKHPYIYAMFNDGTKHYVPDAEKPESTNQALPGAHENSGCSFDFRYHEEREDVSVLNHTRVHVYYKDSTLKLRLQQTSIGMEGEWYDCFEMKDVKTPASGYFSVSSATGDLVDNHDIIHFSVRSLAGIKDPIEDYSVWKAAMESKERLTVSEFDLRPAEALQRDYSRVLRAQAQALKELKADLDKTMQSMEFQLAAMGVGISTARSRLEEKTEDLKQVTEKVEKSDAIWRTQELSDAKESVKAMKEEIEAVKRSSGGWGYPFFFLLILLIALAGIGYNRYRKIMKSHIL